MNQQEVCLYLMSKYREQEQRSLEENIKAYLELNAKGFHVFSPITHSHCIEESRQSKKQFYRMVGDKPAFVQPYKEPDYVAEDLFYIKKFSNKDALRCFGCYQECGNWKSLELLKQQCLSKSHCEPQLYDSGVVGVVLESASETVQYIRMQITNDKIEVLQSKYSKGVVQEYEYMHQNHILVISEETALTQPIESWSEFAL